MSFYSVLSVTPTNEDWIPNYLDAVGKMVTGYGGKYLARTSNHEQLEGVREDVALRIIIEWPSKDAAVSFMNDSDYAPYLEARTAGSKSFHVLIEGKDDLA